MQQLFDNYISDLTKVYSNVLEEVSMLSRLMTGQLYSKDNALLKQVVRLDGEIPRLKYAYPQFDYLTDYIFESEDMFDGLNGQWLFLRKFFRNMKKGKTF